MSRISITAIVIVVGVFVAACQTSGSNVYAGHGPIIFSSNVKVAFEHYKQYDGWGFFAVSEDGKHYGFGGCPSLGACYNDGDQAALRLCHQKSRGVPCRIYADGPHIVWRGIPESGRPFAKTVVVPGRGALTLSERAKRNIQRYLEYDEPSALAISEDGSRTYAVYCIRTPCVSPGAKEAAVAGCNERSNGSPCYLYLLGRKVVWDGQVTE